MYGLEGIEKLLKEMEERNKKYELRRHNREIGYSPKCKVCNSEYLDDIEKLREQNYTYEEILSELDIDNISIMSLSRHFQNHYPKSKDYKEKQQIQALKNIREAYIKYPFLENYFKNKDLETLEEFNREAGFCTDTFTLCELIPAGTVSNSNQCINKLEINKHALIREKAQNSFWFKDEDKREIEINHLNKVTECLNCKGEYNEERLTLLEKIITYNFLNITPNDKELYYNLLNFNGSQEEFIELLSNGKEENQAGK